MDFGCVVDASLPAVAERPLVVLAVAAAVSGEALAGPRAVIAQTLVAALGPFLGSRLAADDRKISKTSVHTLDELLIRSRIEFISPARTRKPHWLSPMCTSTNLVLGDTDRIHVPYRHRHEGDIR